MFLMRADTLRGEIVGGGGGGLALEISSFVGPCEMARADRPVPFGAHLQYSSITQLNRNQQQSVTCIKGGSGS
jgi:hypothetical protein